MSLFGLSWDIPFLQKVTAGMKTLTKAFNTATIQAGERFRIELDANPSTGYLWEIEVKQGSASLHSQTFKRQNEPGEFVCGAAAIEEFVFQAAKITGPIEIEAIYRRPWEKDAPAADKRTFRLNIA